MTCLGFGFAISSKTWCSTWVGSSSGAPQWSHVHFFSGSLMTSVAFGFGRVLPLWPMGLPGNRFSLFLWSPLRVGYIRREGCVCGFS